MGAAASTPRSAASRGPDPIDDSWIVLDGRRFFVAGHTPGGVAYGVFEDEMESYDDPS